MIVIGKENNLFGLYDTELDDWILEPVYMNIYQHSIVTTEYSGINNVYSYKIHHMGIVYTFIIKPNMYSIYYLFDSTEYCIKNKKIVRRKFNKRLLFL